ARRGSASDAPAVGIYPPEYLVHDPADRGAGRSGAPAGDDRLARLGPAAVLDRLPALGLRRPHLRVQVQDDRGAAGGTVPWQRRRRLSLGRLVSRRLCLALLRAIPGLSHA